MHQLAKKTWSSEEQDRSYVLFAAMALRRLHALIHYDEPHNPVQRMTARSSTSSRWKEATRRYGLYTDTTSCPDGSLSHLGPGSQGDQDMQQHDPFKNISDVLSLTCSGSSACTATVIGGCTAGDELHGRGE